MEDKKLTNRKRCLGCKYYGINVCPLMLDCDVFLIDTCPLDMDFFKNIKPGSFEEFILFNDPKLYYIYLMINRRNRLPKVGAKVLTLTNGFGFHTGGQILEVSSIEGINIFLTDTIKNKRFCVSTEDWFQKIFILEE